MAQQNDLTKVDLAYEQALNFRSFVKGGSIQPHWLSDGDRFYFTEKATGQCFLVDPNTNEGTHNDVPTSGYIRDVVKNYLLDNLGP